MLRNLLLQEHSKAQCNTIVTWVGVSRTKFAELTDYFLGTDTRLAQRAGWPLSYIAALHPKLVAPHLEQIVHNLRKPGLPDAIKRHTVRFLQNFPIPENLHGDVMDRCLHFIEDPKEAVAVKAFSLAILKNLSRQYPEILPEIMLLIEAQMADQTPAFTNRARKLFLTKK